MICYPKRNMDKNMLSKLSSAVMLVGGIMAEDCRRILSEFFKKMR